jgi:hypothetical protein
VSAALITGVLLVGGIVTAASGLLRQRRKTQAGQLVHLLDVRAVARQGVPTPGAIAQAFEHAPPLHGAIERHHRQAGRPIGLAGHGECLLHVRPQADDPTSMPLERPLRGARARGLLERRAGLAHGLPPRRHLRMGPLDNRARPRQRRAGSLFLALPERQDGLGAESEGPHVQATPRARSAPARRR